MCGRERVSPVVLRDGVGAFLLMAFLIGRTRFFILDAQLQLQYPTCPRSNHQPRCRRDKNRHFLNANAITNHHATNTTYTADSTSVVDHTRRHKPPPPLPIRYYDPQIPTDEYGVKETEPIGWLAAAMQQQNSEMPAAIQEAVGRGWTSLHTTTAG